MRSKLKADLKNLFEIELGKIPNLSTKQRDALISLLQYPDTTSQQIIEILQTNTSSASKEEKHA